MTDSTISKKDAVYLASRCTMSMEDMEKISRVCWDALIKDPSTSHLIDELYKTSQVDVLFHTFFMMGIREASAWYFNKIAEIVALKVLPSDKEKAN